MTVGIFRTNICTQQDKNSVITAVRDHFNINNCTIDTEDCDYVLRVVAGPKPVADKDIITFVRGLGFQCELLD